MRRRIATLAVISIAVPLAAHLQPTAAYPQQAKPGEAKKSEAETRAVEPIDTSGEPRPAAYKSIAGPKVCLGYNQGEWTVQLRPGDVDWTPIDGWIEVDGGELTKVTGFANLETAVGGKKKPHTDHGRFNKRRIDFDLWVKSGGLDTFRFSVSEEARSIRFRFRIGQKLAAGERILIGKEGRHPSQGEFSLRARPDDTPAKRGKAATGQ